MMSKESMEDIRVDMFDVQLGAAILIQFRAEDGSYVRVLADAGTTKSGYGKDHVLNKLQSVLPSQPELPSPHIDLLICTHYDRDHLNRLVRVIENYEIKEAWLPPVANDTEGPCANWEGPRQNDFLGQQFASSVDGDRKFLDYIDAKAKIINQVDILIDMILDDQDQVRTPVTEQLTFEMERGEEVNHTKYGAFFTQALSSAAIQRRKKLSHACRDVGLPVHSATILEANHRYAGHRGYYSNLEYASMIIMDQKCGLLRPYGIGDPKIHNLATIKESAAIDALNAASLKKVVDALVAAKVTIRFEHINDGEPARFQWEPTRHSFLRVDELGPIQPALTLLGPSKSLINKYWKRLPVAEYACYALILSIPVENTTPQNELSYSMILSYKGQGLLVSGDSGFVDFLPLHQKPKNATFYPQLIEALKVPLPVVQVAHHGGHNKYFYHALLEAKYPISGGANYLLLSHEKDSASRPSGAFEIFVAKAELTKKNVKLLFTSQPSKARVQSIATSFAPVVPAGNHSKTGDVCLVYANEDWVVLKHAVEAPV